MRIRFVDTNVLLYKISREPAEAGKREIAEALLANRDLALSTQVLQEFYVQAIRPHASHALTHGQAEKLIRSFTRFPIQPTTPQIVLSAVETHERFEIAYWDAAILEAAKALGCEVVLTEDLNHGQDYGGVRVENPFLG